tara:strand:+ start:267 stop:470 length:204 start_codon:yes stop_codon:yes gene_type:complete
MHKLKNGVLSEMSAEEQEAQETAGRLAHESAEVMRAEEAQRVIDKANAISKLEALGLTSSEIDALSK